MAKEAKPKYWEVAVAKCVKVAEKHGYTEQEAYDCVDHVLKCEGCPFEKMWAKNRELLKEGN